MARLLRVNLIVSPRPLRSLWIEADPLIPSEHRSCSLMTLGLPVVLRLLPPALLLVPGLLLPLLLPDFELDGC